MILQMDMTVRSEMIETLAAIEPLADEWDELAEALGRPYCAPGWLLPWWRHVAPAKALLRIAVARDDDGRLSGIAPFYAARHRGVWTYRMLAAGLAARVEPLVRPEGAEETLRTLAAELAGATPGPALVLLESMPTSEGWAARLRAAWPGRPFVHSRPAGAAPTAAIVADDVEAWLGRRSSNFRSQMRRFRRRLDEAGAVHRVTESVEQLADDLREFERLHRGRREQRGGTDAFPPGAFEMLLEAGRELLPAGRLRLATIELDGRAIASHLYVGAGRELSYWNGGFDDEFGRLRPSYVGLVDAVAAGIEGGYERFDLGPGTQEYKYRFADGEDQLESVALVPGGVRAARGRVAYAPGQIRFAVSSRLSDERKEWIRSRLRRGGAQKPSG